MTIHSLFNRWFHLFLCILFCVTSAVFNVWYVNGLDSQYKNRNPADHKLAGRLLFLMISGYVQFFVFVFTALLMMLPFFDCPMKEDLNDHPTKLEHFSSKLFYDATIVLFINIVVLIIFKQKGVNTLFLVTVSAFTLALFCYTIATRCRYIGFPIPSTAIATSFTVATDLDFEKTSSILIISLVALIGFFLLVAKVYFQKKVLPEEARQKAVRDLENRNRRDEDNRRRRAEQDIAENPTGQTSEGGSENPTGQSRQQGGEIQKVRTE